MPGGVHPPPQVIAAWPKPNYVDPETEGPALMVVGIVLNVITGLLVLARVYSRCFITRAPGLDDILIVISMAFATALTVMVTLGYKNLGFGRHLWDVPPAWGPRQRLNIWISEFLYIPATCLAKISVMLFYRRLSTTFSKAFEIATWVGIAYNSLYFLGFIIYIGAQCTPYNAYWLQFSPEFLATHKWHCGNEHYSLPVSAALSVVGDFYATALPLLLVSGLDLPQRQKTALYVLFGLGGLVIAAGIVRTVLLNHVINETYDSTWWLWKFWLWTFVEIYVAIMAASAPALKPFFRKYLVEKVLSGSKGSSGRRYGYGYGSGNKRRIVGAAVGEGVGVEGKKLWSNGSSTVRDEGGGMYDVEKIGAAVSSPDGTRKYELKALPSGRIQPVMVNAAEIGYMSEEVPTRSSTINNEEARPAWVLPTPGVEERDGLRSFRAEIEALPPVPRNGSKKSGTMPQRGERVQVHQQQQVTRYASQDNIGRRAAPGWDADEEASTRHLRRASQGSVKMGRMRAESIKKETAVAAAARRAGERAWEKRRSVSVDHEWEGSRSGSGGSSETLHLPRQGSVIFSEEVGGEERRWRERDRERRKHDTASLHLPRQGARREDFGNGDEEWNEVGVAV